MLQKGFTMKFTGKKKERPALSEEQQTLAKWRRKNYMGTALFAVAFSIFLNQLFVLGHLTELSPKYTAVASKQYRVPLGLGLFLYGVCSPIVEELLFRGLVQRGLNRLFASVQKGIYLSVLVTALLFAIYHGNLAQAMFAFPMGILIGLSYVRLLSIYAPIVFHVCANVTTLIAGGVFGFPEGWKGGLNCVLFATICLIILWWQVDKEKIHKKLKEKQG